MSINILNVMSVIDFIENNLTEKLNLDKVARAVHFSKYHIHRVFMNTVGMTIHDYIQRRKLTEAANLLVFSKQSILEIALFSGYESQQAFTDIFKMMYKKSPHQFRKEEQFYPLQLRFKLNKQPTKNSNDRYWKKQIQLAQENDLLMWMDLLLLVVDGFPCLNEVEYIAQLKQSIHKKQAFILKDGNIAIGAMILIKENGNINFLGIHPQYDKTSIANAFIQKALAEVLENVPISITTFREGDKADPGYREIFQALGFVESELLIEFGYPTQKLLLHKKSVQGNHDE